MRSIVVFAVVGLCGCSLSLDFEAARPCDLPDDCADGYRCALGTCTPEGDDAICGDFVVSSSEACDDGNDSGDEGWCNAACDDAGMLPGYCRAEADSGLDGSINRVIERTWDPRGLRTRQTYDRENDDFVDVIETWGYDRKGWSIRYTYEETSGDDPTIYTNTYEVDEETGKVQRVEYDDESNDSVDAVGYYSYETNGDYSFSWDYFGDGTYDEVHRYFVNGSGRLERYEMDSNNDGTLDGLQYWYYDADGNMVRWERDAGADGSIQERDLYTYDSNGWALHYEWDIAPEGGSIDGVTDFIEDYTYDSDGNRLTADADVDAVGGVDSSAHYSYDCW